MNDSRGRERLVFVLVLFIVGCLLVGRAEATIQCYDCHGTRNPVDFRPLDAAYRNITSGGFQGNHRNHLQPGAGPASCTLCHPGSDAYTTSHRDGVVTLAPRLNNSPAATRYTNHTTAWQQNAFPDMGQCSNVNCHFETLTPPWGSPTLARNDCTTCHGAPPATGSHGKKHGEYYGTGTDSCSRCHSDHTQESNPLAHAADVGTRPLAVQFGGVNAQGRYSGNVSYPDFLPSKNPARSGSCLNLYCHSNGAGGAPRVTPRWSGQGTTTCYSCHGGRKEDNTQADCSASGGNWDSTSQICTPSLTMSSNGHARLVGPQWVRKYSCYYCHNATTNADGTLKDQSMHVNGARDVEMSPQWNIVGRPLPSYDPQTKICDNVYCHSDGTANPETVRPFAWTEPKTECNTCHGHPRGSCSSAGCHDGRTDTTGKVWTVKTGWPSGQEWKAAIPMFANEGAGMPRANSHPRHTETSFTCDNCHASTVVNGICTDCHKTGIPTGQMGEVAHINANYHVNKSRDVVFLNGGSYDPVTKVCTNTVCHTGGTDPVWGDSVTRSVICLNCHGTTAADYDDFGMIFNGTRAKINLNEWQTTGHGRQLASGPYPASGNPPANFPGNPCWYCHDNNVLHMDGTNPFRLRKHPQFSKRFEKECVYCHMEGLESECLGCHNSGESLAIQLSYSSVMTKHGNSLVTTGCRNAGCHDSDASLHKTGAGFWDAAKKEDVRNQYEMMGVCLQCHDDDTGGKCNQCHVAPPENPMKYSLGFDPGTGFIKPQKARASSVHFGYKHYRAYQQNGVWKGGKFCWDCHDPHGDTNIYMIQGKVATSTDGTFGKPLSRATVTFTRKQSGLDYARINAPYDGICNVCHAAGSQHYRSDGGDGHNAGRICTSCHEHRFTDSHADDLACNTCHLNKPVPRHSGFGLPRDCTKCHGGIIGNRMDVMSQLKANSHHIQGIDPNNKHCYACHWESTPEGLIDIKHHEGYNYKNYSSVKNAKVDLVVWEAGIRPTFYNSTTSISFLASNIGSSDVAVSRAESSKVNNHCISCHSDQNNDTQPFGDCKTPRQYAWDGQSIAARYSQLGTTPWGKYNSTTFAKANKKDTLAKAFSAHGNAKANQGGWETATGYDGAISNSRNGTYNVNCFDCHSSHGSKVVGVTSSYVTFNGTRNGANLKETQAGKGGYTMNYKASSNADSGSVNPYNTGAGQCFDCHLTQNAGTTPWGYQSTFGATKPIMGYGDTERFGQGMKGSIARFTYRDTKKTIVGGHLKASSMLNYTTAAQDRIGGLCTPCHDPHGVSPTLGGNRSYAVPLLKGTWLTSPYQDDSAQTALGSSYVYAEPTWRSDRNTFSTMTDNTKRVNESDSQFAGLCLRCHKKGNLTDGVNKNTSMKSLDRVHESVKGWGANDEHSFTCSKCHQPHNSGLPRLMKTNCLDWTHRGQVKSGGTPNTSGWRCGSVQGFPRGKYSFNQGVSCHGDSDGTSNFPTDTRWNNVTPWQ
ncbi:MAG: CxxxxCH/CxxCH domain-containing protein [Geobacter sp.]|nr:CxxxxCH/CxxCH domain-containing protein [Geobacter sp.]